MRFYDTSKLENKMQSVDFVLITTQNNDIWKSSKIEVKKCECDSSNL